MNLATGIGMTAGVGILLLAQPVQVAVRSALYSVQTRRGLTPRALALIVVGALLGGYLFSQRSPGIVGTFLGLGCGTFCGWWVHRSLEKQALQQLHLQQTLLTPAFLDRLSLTISTGMSLASAIDYNIAKLPPQLKVLWGDVRLNPEESLLEYLQATMLRSHHPPTKRIANSLIIAFERGTPTAEVLLAQAQEVRAEARRTLLDIAAKKDIQMMMPVVFGILPSITAIALYPAFISLNTLS